MKCDRWEGCNNDPKMEFAALLWLVKVLGTALVNDERPAQWTEQTLEHFPDPATLLSTVEQGRVHWQ